VDGHTNLVHPAQHGKMCDLHNVGIHKINNGGLHKINNGGLRRMNNRQPMERTRQFQASLISMTIEKFHHDLPRTGKFKQNPHYIQHILYVNCERKFILNKADKFSFL